MNMLAVVPIFVGAGAAVLPTLLAAAASVMAILLKPRELLRLILRRPLAAFFVIFAVGLSSLGIYSLVSHGPQKTVAAGRKPVDWAKVAEEIIARGGIGAGSSVDIKIPETGPATTGKAEGAGAAAGGAMFVGRDVTRASFDGGASPVGLRPLWAFRPEETMFIACPVVDVARKKIFVGGSQTDLGGYTGLLACLDGETGKPVWQVTSAGDDTLHALFSSPAVTADGKYVVVGQGLHTDKDCALVCFEAATGKLHWAVKTPLHLESSPVIFGDVAVVGAGAIERNGRAEGNPGYVVAVRISDGKELWRQQVNDPESSPAVDAAGTVYIGSGFNGTAVVALRSEPAEELAAKKLDRVLWKTTVPMPVTSAITLTPELVVAGAGNGDFVHSDANPVGMVLGLDRKTGEVKWKTAFEDAVLGDVAYRDGVLYCPIRTGEVAAVSATDGKVVWRARVSGSSPVLAGCAVTSTHVYAVSSDGTLAVLDVKDGRVVEKLFLNDQAKPGTGLCLGTPQVVGGRLYVGTETGGFRCLVGGAK